jgi:hypothetical protein
VARLATPKLEIWLDENDDAPVVVQAINADMVLGETTARKHGWGTFTEAPMKNQTFLAWAALKRTGQLRPPGQTYEEFEKAALSITLAGDSPADPTQPGQGSG